MLKQLGNCGIEFLTEIIKLSLSSAKFPLYGKSNCLKGLPIHKPNKQADQGKSYRPYSLLSPVAKLIENSSNGFYKNISTETTPTWFSIVTQYH